MKKSGKNMMKLTMVILIAVIIILVGIIIKNLNSKISKKEEGRAEQLGETTDNNAYISMSDHLSEISEQQKELNDIEAILGETTVTADKILKDYTAYKDGKLITGTMANNGAVSQTLNAGGSYTIPAGYHNGSGKVTANSLASQTSATATAADIASGKTAWVNGELITGNVKNENKTTIVKVALASASRGTYTVDVAAFITNNNLDIDYTKLTDDNFGYERRGASTNTAGDSISAPTYSYNASTGILSIKNPYVDGSGRLFANGIPYLYYVAN